MINLTCIRAAFCGLLQAPFMSGKNYGFSESFMLDGVMIVIVTKPKPDPVKWKSLPLVNVIMYLQGENFFIVTPDLF